MSIKETIIDQYHQLVLLKKSTKITVKELCEACSISRTTFYKYYKDTYAVLETIVFIDAMEPLKQLVTSSSLNVTNIILNWYFSFFKHRSFYLIAIHDESQNALFDTIISQLETYNKLIYAQSNTSHLSQQDIDYIAYKNAATQAMLLKKWMKEGMLVTPEKMAEYFLTDLNLNTFE